MTTEELRCQFCGLNTQSPGFDSWKRAFDSDPADRKGSGVRRFEVLRSVDEPNYVMIDLEFDSLDEAEGLLSTMRRIWSVDGQRGHEGSTSPDR